MKKGVVYAFPYPSFNAGMTLRDYFAGQALAGLMTVGSDINLNTFERRAKICYVVADAMLAERENSK